MASSRSHVAGATDYLRVVTTPAPEDPEAPRPKGPIARRAARFHEEKDPALEHAKRMGFGLLKLLVPFLLVSAIVGVRSGDERRPRDPQIVEPASVGDVQSSQ